MVEQLIAEQPGIDVWQQDVTTVELDDDFDVILVLGGLHHVPHAAGDVVHRLARHLRPGGFFVSLEPTHGNRLFQWARERIYRRDPLFDEQTERGFAVWELFGFFKDAGLECHDAAWPGLASYVLYYNPDAFPSLNLGGARAVRTAFALDRPFFRTRLGRICSFATLSLWRRPDPADTGGR